MVATSTWAFATTNPITDELADAAALVLVLEILFLPTLYQWLMVGQWGQTLGKMALGERVVRAENAGRVGYARAAGRVASAWLLGIFVLPLLLAFLWPLWEQAGSDGTLERPLPATPHKRPRHLPRAAASPSPSTPGSTQGSRADPRVATRPPCPRSPRPAPDPPSVYERLDRRARFSRRAHRSANVNRWRIRSDWQRELRLGDASGMSVAVTR